VRKISLAPAAFFLLGTTRLTLALEEWRRRRGPAVVGWLRAVGECEALCALAGYAFENPDDPFPEVVEGSALLDARALGHPLLPRDRCVPNDVSLGAEARVLIVSGSNMAGKSTLLRTVGVNVVLALAGGPVRAERLWLSPLVVGATLRIQDSLQAGRSRFQAEVLRVRQLLDLARGPTPLLFLLDELFAGTSSHDRRGGAEAVLRTLLDAGAVGLATTHDLALTELAEGLGRGVANIHLVDRFENGEMVFDYRVRPGVVPHSNGLALMRAVGIVV
jgi:DNA mismatch repair ATPase MutS